MKKLVLTKLNAGFYKTNAEIIEVGETNPEMAMPIYIERHMDDPTRWNMSYISTFRSKKSAVEFLRDLIIEGNGEYCNRDRERFIVRFISK